MRSHLVLISAFFVTFAVACGSSDSASSTGAGGTGGTPAVTSKFPSLTACQANADCSMGTCAECETGMCKYVVKQPPGTASPLGDGRCWQWTSCTSSSDCVATGASFGVDSWCWIAGSSGLCQPGEPLGGANDGCWQMFDGGMICREVAVCLNIVDSRSVAASPASTQPGGCPVDSAAETCTDSNGTTVVFQTTPTAWARQNLCTTTVSRDAGVTPQPAGCPVWPRTKLMPIVGPLFYGPNPGPCTVASSKYNYDTQGRLTSIDDAAGSSLSGVAVWNGDVLVSIGEDNYEWGSNYVKNTFPDGTVRYELDAKGYPQSLTSTSLSSGETVSASFEYANCRLIKRTGKNSDGTVNLDVEMTYEYDTAGRVASRLSGNGDGDYYDYSCWGQ
jgi:hypothetical protein